MPSIFERLYRVGPASLLFKAIIVAIVLDALLLAFILLRRTYRKRYFKKRDARVYELRQRWHALISGEIPFETWRRKPFDRRIVEEIALDAFEASGPEESARLLKFLRDSGLIEKRIFEARNHRGWRRLRALVRAQPREGCDAVTRRRPPMLAISPGPRVRRNSGTGVVPRGKYPVLHRTDLSM